MALFLGLFHLKNKESKRRTESAVYWGWSPGADVTDREGGSEMKIEDEELKNRSIRTMEMIDELDRVIAET